jgi:hypothetical protein
MKTNTANPPNVIPSPTPAQYFCIYQPGQQHIQCASKDSPPRNYSGELFEGVLARLNAERSEGTPEFEIMHIDNATEQIGRANHAAYCGPWQEITKEKWWDMLEVLPPEKWQTVAGVEIFRMCEYLTGNITAHYARLEDRYFVRNLPTSTPYSDIAAQVAALVA